MVHQNLGICYTRFTPMCYHAIQRINQGSFWSQKISRLQHFPSKWCLNPCMLTRKSLTQHYQMLFSSPSDSNAPSDDSDGHNGGSPRHKDIVRLLFLCQYMSLTMFLDTPREPPQIVVRKFSRSTGIVPD